jgi:3D (Asp-Asp-Asp) domain-containing protein
MHSRKQQKRIRRYLMIAAIAIVVNIIVPSTAKAQSVSLPDSLDNSTAGIAQDTPQQTSKGSLTTLPTPTDKPVTVKKTLTLRASAYSSTVDQCDSDPFTTASGKKVADGIIAMNGLPFGTKVRIPSHFGTKVFVVQDRMNAKWGMKRLDIWMPTRAAAIQWGVRTVTIEIIS